MEDLKKDRDKLTDLYHKRMHFKEKEDAKSSD
jgi:hypothetical protein